MSEALERIEKMASTDVIRNVGEIHRIMCSLLNLSYAELAQGKGYHDYLAADIARGFVLDEQKVKKCTIKEILTIIGYMPGAPWYEVDKDEKWFTSSDLGPDFYSAPACFFMSDILYNAGRYNPVVMQFLHIGYSALMWYLDVMKTAENKSVLLYIPEYHSESIAQRRFEVTTVRYVRNNSVNGSELPINDITLGDILQTMHRKGFSSWMCGTELLADYINKILLTYTTAQNLLMNSIRKNLIDMGRSDFLELMNRCSENKEYEYSDCFDFSSCYE